MMHTKLLAAAAVMTLVAGSAFAAGSSQNAPGPRIASSQTSIEFPLTSDTVADPGIQPHTVPLIPGETPHVIGGQTFYFSPGIAPPGGN